MMFDMIRNYFRVESDDFGRFWVLKSERTIADALPTGTPPPGGGNMPTILRLPPRGGSLFDEGLTKTKTPKLAKIVRFDSKIVSDHVKHHCGGEVIFVKPTDEDPPSGEKNLL